MTSEGADANTPRCSIGLPVYNGENYLEEAIQSVLDQSFQDFELIISDNASTDATPEICQAFAERDSRITYVRHPRNIGAAKNYNYVFHLARAQHFNWLAHDDILEPDFLSTCLSGFDAADRDTVLVYPAFRYIDEHGNQIDQEHPSCVHTAAGTPARRMYEVLEGLGIVTSIFGMFRRTELARTRLIGSYIASDYVLLAECALLGKIIRLDCAPQFMRRLHDEGSQRANRTPDEVAKWFDPDTVADARPARRVSREYLNAILLTPGQSAFGRLSAFAYLAVQRGRLKRRAKRARRMKA
ncbi:glycosyltransferase family 2 protein [Pikeienuella piscinae]|uniref:Glycosyltransferase family 2 protein n=1 Tax=Pikeienuella piscinae TaxID=2748098 RepID=A0A7L5C202_9RHOB|nr:glycosyltransferase family 2 protein [Pikeienuella piscinae]QIE56847.1 glycosyltransferase family 2 protein [Pikeienuella piscinae]